LKCPSCSTDGLTGLYCSNCGAKLPVNEEKEVNAEVSENKDILEQEQSDNEKVVLKSRLGADQYGYIQKREVGFTPKKIYIFFGIIAAIILLFIINNSNQNTNNSVLQQHKGVQLISEGKWDEAAQSLSSANNGDLKVLYNYAESHISMNKNDYEMALHYVSETPANYNGILSNDVINYKIQLESDKVKHGFDLIENKNYDKAATWFYGLSKNNSTLEPLYNYAQAVSKYYTGDYNMAQFYAKAINDYSGYGSDIVTAFKEKVLSEVTPEKIVQQEARDKAAKKSQGVRIGMTKQDVLGSNWGKPNHINKTTRSYGVHEQWVYSGNNYLYFEDGILTTIQN